MSLRQLFKQDSNRIVIWSFILDSVECLVVVEYTLVEPMLLQVCLAYLGIESGRFVEVLFGFDGCGIGLGQFEVGVGLLQFIAFSLIIMKELGIGLLHPIAEIK